MNELLIGLCNVVEVLAILAGLGAGAVLYRHLVR